MEGFLRYEFGGLISRGAYTWRGLFSEFYCLFSVPQTYIRENSFLPHYISSDVFFVYAALLNSTDLTVKRWCQ